MLTRTSARMGHRPGPYPARALEAAAEFALVQDQGGRRAHERVAVGDCSEAEVLEQPALMHEPVAKVTQALRKAWQLDEWIINGQHNVARHIPALAPRHERSPPRSQRRTAARSTRYRTTPIPMLIRVAEQPIVPTSDHLSGNIVRTKQHQFGDDRGLPCFSAENLSPRRTAPGHSRWRGKRQIAGPTSGSS